MQSINISSPPLNTYEGIMVIKWDRKDYGGDRRGITIDTKNRKTLNKELRRIRYLFKNEEDSDSNDKRLAYSVTFEEFRKRQ